MFAFTAAVLTLFFIEGNSWGNVFALSMLGAIVNYLLGDLLVVPSWGNVVGALGDGVFAAAVAFAYNFIVPAFHISFTALGIFAALIFAAEYVFHLYLLETKQVSS